MPADLLIDTGHPAGLRMRDRGGFNDPASPKQALLIECGQHWEKRAVDVARDTTLRFLAATGIVAVRSHRRAPDRDAASRGSVSCASPSRSSHARWPSSSWCRSKAWESCHGPAPRSPATATQSGRAPYDDTVLVMPSMRHLKPGNTQVRLGRYDT